MMAQMMMVLGAPSERPDTLGLEQVQLLCILTTSFFVLWLLWLFVAKTWTTHRY